MGGGGGGGESGLTAVQRASLTANLRRYVLAQLTHARVDTLTELRRRVRTKVLDTQLARVVVIRQTTRRQPVSNTTALLSRNK